MSAIITLKAAGQDFEFYPTTDEIISDSIAAITKQLIGRPRQLGLTILDPCAGDGRFLDYCHKHLPTAFGEVRLFGCEISKQLRDRWSRGITMLGVDAMESFLADCSPDVVVCNPPYSAYEMWVEKVIGDVTKDTLAVFVIPARWRTSRLAEFLGDNSPHTAHHVSFADFANGDRKARAKVEVILVEAYAKDVTGNFSAMDRLCAKLVRQAEEPELEEAAAEESVTESKNIIEVSLANYERRVERLRQALPAVLSIPADVRAAVELDTAAVKKVISAKLKSVRADAWNRLFSDSEEIRKRLTSTTWRVMRDRMEKHGRMEFSRNNVYAVLEDIILRSNEHADEQTIWLFEKLAQLANTENYKSNHKVYVERRFGYGYEGEQPSHIRLKLGHRLVLDGMRGLDVSRFQGKNTIYGATETLVEFIADVRAVAHSYGYDIVGQRAADAEIERGEELSDDMPRMWEKWDAHRYTLYHRDARGALQEFATFKAHMTYTVHVKLLPEFVTRLSARHGLLKGWLRDDSDKVSEEFGYKVEPILTKPPHITSVHRL